MLFWCFVTKTEGLNEGLILPVLQNYVKRSIYKMSNFSDGDLLFSCEFLN